MDLQRRPKAAKPRPQGSALCGQSEVIGNPNLIEVHIMDTKSSNVDRGPLRDEASKSREVALVTGGASGIGRALSEALARRGTQVIVADRQWELAGKVVSAIQEGGGHAQAVELDVRDPVEFERIANQVREEFGRIDYLFNNAGIAIGGEVSRTRLEDWQDVLDVNLRGIVHGVQAVYPILIEQGFGHIVNTGSIAGLLPSDGVVYSTSKHAIVGLSKSLRLEAARYGVRVSVLCPGLIRTPILTGGVFGRANLPGVDRARLEAFWERRPVLAPEELAKRALAQIERNRLYIIVPGWCKLFWYLERLSPCLSARFWRWQGERMRSELGGS